jgi:hypothetical protein
MHELLTDRVGLFIGKEPVGASARLLFKGETEGVVGEDAFRAGDGVDAAVGTGRAAVMLDQKLKESDSRESRKSRRQRLSASISISP